jgi:hypothetical protein
MATLPNTARRSIPLDVLLARHAPARPASGPKPHPAHRPAPATLAELERRASLAPRAFGDDSSERSSAPLDTRDTAERSEGGSAPLAPASLAPDTAAVALVLCLTRASCACGRTYTYPNRAVLVRFDRAGLSNAVHYARGTLSQYADLPRERKTLDIEIPYCDECF